jgi:cytoskeletal protein RodZ
MSGKDDGAHAELKIGRTLELTRKERGLSLRQVEQGTKIRVRYLRELERENFDVLPPVYVQGSLKTYANFLGLNGEALARELRRRRPPENEPEAPAHIEPPKGDPDRTQILPGGAAGAGTWEVAEDQEDAAAASVPEGDNHRLLYLVSGAFLVLVAIALVLALARDSRPEVTRVREPLISPAPSEVSRAGGRESERAYPQSQEGDQQSSDGAGSQPGQDAAPPNAEAQGGDPTGQPGQSDPSPTQDPPDETAARPSPAEQEITPNPPATEPAANTAPPASTPAEAPIQDGVRADDPASPDDEVLVTRDGIQVSSQDGDKVEIRRGKGGLKIRATEDRAVDEGNGR